MISLIIPIFNEQEVIPELYRRLRVVLEPLADFEVIFIDDGSNDDSINLLQNIATTDERYKIIELARNFGQQSAYTAGLWHARGEVIIMMDADLQDPPELIPEFLNQWRAGYQVVYGVRRFRAGESWLKIQTATWFYWLINKLSPTTIPCQASDFRLLDRQVVEVVKNLGEYHRFLRGLIAWTGFKQIGVEFDRHERHAGNTKYPLSKMVRLALDAICSFSIQPLRLAMYLGFGTALFSFIILAKSIVDKYIMHATVIGWTSIIVAILFLGGVQLIAVGILGEYIGRIYEQTKGRPIFIIKNKTGIKDANIPNSGYKYS